MKSGRASRTAVKVAWLTAALSADPRFADQFPARAGALSKRLLKIAGFPLYRESMMPLVSSPIIARLSGPRSAVLYEGFACRRAFMNRQVIAALDRGATQVLVVGAGFDTLCLRLAPEYPERRFYEVDHPATSAVKSEGVREIGRPSNMRLVTADLAQARLSEVMRRTKGWECDAKTVAVCEGLLMYLNPGQTRELFAELSACTGPRSRVAFSHLLDLDGQGPLTLLGLRLLGEPWLSSNARDEIPHLWADFGYRVLEQDDGSRGHGDLEGLAVVERMPDAST